MSINTILLVLIALLVSAGIAFYQYFYNANNKSRLHLLLAFLRFASIFLVLLLLINPIISKSSLEVEKIPLVVAVDNSESIAFLKENKAAQEISQKILENSDLKNKYQIQSFTFDEDLNTNDTLSFKGKQTNIYKAFEGFKQLFRGEQYPLVLVTDGNQTQGNDYVFKPNGNSVVYPVVLGDTIVHFDLKINQLNVNKYALLKNTFPVETFLFYNGKKPIQASLLIQENGKTIAKQQVSFSATNTSNQTTIFLPADKVGVHVYKAVITSPEKELNTINNSKNFAVEVIDQRTEIALISSINHPDIGVLKRSIEANSLRKVTIFKPKEINDLNNYNVLILYQPNYEFKSVLEQNKNAKINALTITGLHTDFGVVSQYQSDFTFKIAGQKEDYSGDFNNDFSNFAVEDLGFAQFPPLEHPFGKIISNTKQNVLLQSTIRNIASGNPLLTFTETVNNRNAYLFGENFWKWRMESYLKEKSFSKFDNFIDKTIQYLASNSKKKSLVVTHESFYNAGESITISAQYFDKNYEFDENANLTIQMTNTQTKATKVSDFLKGSNEYLAVFENLTPGNYTLLVREKKSNAQYVSSFHVIDFDAEKQFTNADINRLKQVATESGGKCFASSQADALVKFLTETEQYKPVQKEIITKAPLIDWVWGLVLLILLLSTEWFVRKYNGLL